MFLTFGHTFGVRVQKVQKVQRVQKGSEGSEGSEGGGGGFAADYKKRARLAPQVV